MLNYNRIYRSALISQPTKKNNDTARSFAQTRANVDNISAISVGESLEMLVPRSIMDQIS